MAYEIHIKRKNDQPISLEEWVKAVDNSENVRLGEAVPTVVTNSTTGEQIWTSIKKLIAPLRGF